MALVVSDQRHSHTLFANFSSFSANDVVENTSGLAFVVLGTGASGSVMSLDGLATVTTPAGTDQYRLIDATIVLTTPDI